MCNGLRIYSVNDIVRKQLFLCFVDGTANDTTTTASGGIEQHLNKLSLHTPIDLVVLPPPGKKPQENIKIYAQAINGSIFVIVKYGISCAS